MCYGRAQAANMSTKHVRDTSFWLHLLQPRNHVIQSQPLVMLCTYLGSLGIAIHRSNPKCCLKASTANISKYI
jgi:hypothetical protein